MMKNGLLTIAFAVLAMSLGCGEDNTDGQALSEGQPAKSTTVSWTYTGESKSDFEVAEPESYCATQFGCTQSQTCIDGGCQTSCFDKAECSSEETCRWNDSRDTVDCIPPWTCSLSNEQSTNVTGSECSIMFECSESPGRDYEVRCMENDGCVCLEDDKIVGVIQIPSDAPPFSLCSAAHKVISELNSRCGWAIQPTD